MKISVYSLCVYIDNAIIPEPKEDEIHVKVKAVSLNPSDYQTIEFMQNVPSNQTVLGLDISGIIDKVGSSVKDLEVGDRVVFLRDITKTNGVDYILSTVNSTVAYKKLKIFSFDGEMVVTADFSKFDLWKFYDRQLSLHEIALGKTLSHKNIEVRKSFRKLGDSFINLINNGLIRSPLLTKISLNEVPTYLKMVKLGNISGKVVITF